MKIIEVRRFDGEDKIFIDDQLFDWGLDDAAVSEINSINNREELEKIHENIMEYFLNCIEQFLGKKTSIKEFYESLASGKFE